MQCRYAYFQRYHILLRCDVTAAHKDSLAFTQRFTSSYHCERDSAYDSVIASLGVVVEYDSVRSFLDQYLYSE
jgi:hypothetical protein